MPIFELPKKDCEALGVWLNGYDLTKAVADIGATSRADNSEVVESLGRLRHALGSAATNTFDATIILSILNQAEKGYPLDEVEQRPYVRRLLEYGYLIGRGPDHHDAMRITGLHERGASLRDFLEWWKNKP